jgi:hypothetical protein
MNKGQFIGSLFDAGIWIALGVFVQFFQARQVKKRIELGKEKPEMAEKLKKNGWWFGWLLILFGIIKMAGVFLGES